MTHNSFNWWPKKKKRHNQKKNQGIETENRDDRQISMDIKPAIINMPHAY